MKALVALLFLVPSFAHAYFVASLTGPIDPAKPAHVIVSGRGQNLGRQPQLAALGAAARIHEANPSSQVVLISVFEDATNEPDLRAKGIVILRKNDAVAFDTASIMPELLKFSQIQSLHFFGHNSPSLGTQTDGPGARFDFRERSVAQLRSHFTQDAYLFIHGCNGGWLLAPMLSRELAVPVAGAFTETHFERLNADGNFYVADATQVPNLNWAHTNTQSYAQPRECAKGGCLRMRPANEPYTGHWGDYGAGLGFYKFFCEMQTQAQCDRTMALALINELTTSRAQISRDAFIAAAKDLVCPASKDRALSQQCANEMDQALTHGARAYSSFARPAIQCDFKTCATKFTCTSTGGPNGVGECTLTQGATAQATTQTNEFLAYVRGYDALAAGH